MSFVAKKLGLRKSCYKENPANGRVFFERVSIEQDDVPFESY